MSDQTDPWRPLSELPRPRRDTIGRVLTGPIVGGLVRLASDVDEMKEIHRKIASQPGK